MSKLALKLGKTYGLQGQNKEYLFKYGEPLEVDNKKDYEYLINLKRKSKIQGEIIYRNVFDEVKDDQNKENKLNKVKIDKKSIEKE